MKTIYLAYLVIAMQLGDVVLTYLGIKAGAREVNPIMVWLQKILPGKWTWLFLAKAVMIPLIYWVASHYGESANAPLVGLVALYAWVLANNWRVLKKQKRK